MNVHVLVINQVDIANFWLHKIAYICTLQRYRLNIQSMPLPASVQDFKWYLIAIYTQNLLSAADSVQS